MRAALTMTAVVTVGMFLGAGAAAAAPVPPVPNADQLTSQLRRVLNPGVSDSERAAALQGGQAAVPTANNIAAQMDRYDSMISWNVQDPALNDSQLDAQLAVTFAAVRYPHPPDLLGAD